jgi:dethiobiotin synthetase
VLVTANRLGTINHTLLTLSALELGGILAAGVVLSAPEV